MPPEWLSLVEFPLPSAKVAVILPGNASQKPVLPPCGITVGHDIHVFHAGARFGHARRGQSICFKGHFFWGGKAGESLTHIRTHRTIVLFCNKERGDFFSQLRACGVGECFLAKLSFWSEWVFSSTNFWILPVVKNQPVSIKNRKRGIDFRG